jgi:O-antigen/teichoic acid export membrane protein
MAGLRWVDGVGDRYLIGGLLGLGQAGIYSAVYGLLSRPFLMASGVVELTVRPHYYQKVADGEHGAADRLLMKWVILVGVVVGIGVASVYVLHDLIASLLLADAYRGGADIMVWIASGYALLAISDVFRRACLAYGLTGRLLAIQIVGALVSLGFSTLGILHAELLGAAIAVPAYFAFLLFATFLAARGRFNARHHDNLEVCVNESN